MVGPNGSGKSNVIDAMLFVFGYRAKPIRHNSEDHQVSQLPFSPPHHTTPHHTIDLHPLFGVAQNLDFCRVTVYFQMIEDDATSPDAFTVVPGSAFAVTRRAYASGASVFDIDGKKLPFKEVGQILRAKGIDLDHNRFLILQGEVEQIAMMKPKAQTEHDTGLLEYLEDIIGSDTFKEPIADAEKQV